MALDSSMSISSSDFPGNTAKQPASAPSSGLPERTSATSPGSGDALMAALKLTLQRMGLDPSALTSASSDVTDTDSFSDHSGTAAGALAREDANKSAGKQFLVALYQALVLQHSLNATAQQVGDPAQADQVTSAYVDLGSSIEELAKTVRSTSVKGNDPSDVWDWQLDDPQVSTSGSDAGTSDSTTLAGAVSTLDNALQSYVAPDGNAGEVPLADVLDGLSEETKGVRWDPIGLFVDVKI
ncbi:hypothetical protein LJR029_006143 [Caballeronia sp. LjRoot29]|uniref:hypothetical protein n=1 Tax=Caballeronia sp. LjRoot29 TaxID=3342315 RepID=UPI003ED0E898